MTMNPMPIPVGACGFCSRGSTWVYHDGECISPGAKQHRFELLSPDERLNELHRRMDELERLVRAAMLSGQHRGSGD